MSFKKKLLALGLMGFFVIVVLTISLISVFANNNLLVKTNVTVSYKGITLEDAYVATRSWRMGDEGKTEHLASVNAKEAPEASSITTELTTDYTYVVYEFELYNRGTAGNYYFQVTYQDDCFIDTSNSADGNMIVKYCSSADVPIEVDEILSSELTTLNGYYWNEATRLSNNVVATPGQTVYAYAFVCIDDANYQGSFSGNFVCNVSLEQFSNTSQEGSVQYGPVNGYSTEPIYYIKMGEMPQSWAGTDGSNYTATDEVYTEFGADYPIFEDSLGNRYAQKNGAYYKIEPIIWQVMGVYGSQESSYSNNKFSSFWYGVGRFSEKTRTNLVVISINVLFYSEWHNSLTRVNYPNSTIFAKLNEFYNNVLVNYGSKIVEHACYYAPVETSTQDYMHTTYTTLYESQKLWLFNMELENGWSSYVTTYKRKAFSTNWAVGSQNVDYTNWWLRNNQYNVANNKEVYKSLYINTRGSFIYAGADFTEVMGVRPAMQVSL